MPEKRPNTKRERIDTGRSSSYVRRDEQGQFRESEDVGRASRTDQRHEARHPSRPGHGDRGDRGGK
jgi:hypothetical protein